MRRPLKNSPRKLSADSQRLITLSQAIIQASSRLEERQWETQIDTLLRKIMGAKNQEALDAALDHLFKQTPAAYDALTDSIEAASESCVIEHEHQQYDVLLVAAPILAWTRFSIAAGPIAADMVTVLSAHLQAHVLATETRLAMAPVLFSIDQLPRSHADIASFTRQMAQAALEASSPIKIPGRTVETAPFLADTRYLLAAIVVKSGEAMFRWQQTTNPADRDDALTQWHTQAMPTITRLLPGCGIELLLPEAYFVACREGDKQIRPGSIRAAVHYLTHTLNLEATALQAIIGGFTEEESSDRVDEYRIGFAPINQPGILYGVVWPLYGDEEAEESSYRADATQDPASMQPKKSPLEEIHGLLEECGIIRVQRHHESFRMEFCDDCGSPLFADSAADLVHAEMPEEAVNNTGHLH